VFTLKVILKKRLLVGGIIVTICKFQWTIYKQIDMVTDYKTGA